MDFIATSDNSFHLTAKDLLILSFMCVRVLGMNEISQNISPCQTTQRLLSIHNIFFHKMQIF